MHGSKKVNQKYVCMYVYVCMYAYVYVCVYIYILADTVGSNFLDLTHRLAILSLQTPN